MAELPKLPLALVGSFRWSFVSKRCHCCFGRAFFRMLVYVTSCFPVYMVWFFPWLYAFPLCFSVLDVRLLLMFVVFRFLFLAVCRPLLNGMVIAGCVCFRVAILYRSKFPWRFGMLNIPFFHGFSLIYTVITHQRGMFSTKRDRCSLRLRSPRKMKNKSISQLWLSFLWVLDDWPQTVSGCFEIVFQYCLRTRELLRPSLLVS